MTDLSAKIKHDEKTIIEMAKTQYQCYKPKSYAYLSAVSMALMLLAVLMPGLSQLIRGIMIAMACFTVIGINNIPKRLGKQVISSLNGKFPEIYYFFDEDEIKLTGADAANAQSYSGISRLVETKDHLYLFLENHSAYMLDKKYARPDVNSVKSFLEEKTSLSWGRPGKQSFFAQLKEARAKAAK